VTLAKSLFFSAVVLAMFAGCSKTDASAAPTDKPGDKPADAAPPTATVKGDTWNADAKVTHDKKGNVWTLEVGLHVTGDGFHVNPDYPYKFAGDKDLLVTFEKDPVAKDDKRDDKDKTSFFSLDKCKKNDKGVDECTELHLVLKLTPKDGAAMDKMLASGVLRFGVCNASSCKFDKAHLGVMLSAAKNV
jgi:hypothetical protein